MQDTSQQRAGQFIQADFFANTGGLNLTDSPFAVNSNEASAGSNFDYVRTGGVEKTRAPALINQTQNGQLLTRGFDLYNTKSGTRQAMRFATSSIQTFNTDSGATTDLTEDTAAAGSSVYSGSTQVISRMMVTNTTDVLWTAGGGVSALYGAYSTSKYTKNGSVTPTGTLGAVVSASGGSFTTGTYYYAVALRKASTQAISNASLDVSAVIANATDKVTLSFSSLGAIDTTKYDKIYVYRSSVGGVSGFTAGALVAQVDSTQTSYVDTGSSLTSSVVVPRSGSSSLDNSELPSGTYESLAVFKRRLVTASGSTLYLSDLDKPESWPAANYLTVPSGGKITGLAVLGYNHPGAGVTDEYLVVFKTNEVWVLKGTDSTDWELLFLDYAGCPAQSLIVNANGLLYWVNSRGVFLWDGAGKPIYTSRKIEYIFGLNGSLDTDNLSSGSGCFLPAKNQVIWYLSDNDIGYQQYVLKLDLRLTLPAIANILGQRVLEGVFVQGKRSATISAARTVEDPDLSTDYASIFLGDGIGNMYREFSETAGTGNDVDFSYTTADLDLGSVGQAKRFHKVILWVDDVGNWNINLDYWVTYRTGDGDATTLTAAISQSSSQALGIWDVGYWDVMYWDDSRSGLVPVVFNIPYAEGDAIRLRFRNANSGEPITINGFSIVYTNISLRK